MICLSIDVFRTTFNEFSARHSKDERFRIVEKIRDRETWFHEYVQELKTRVKDGSNRYNDKEKVCCIQFDG
jgi:transcription elongation regulator 1